MNDIERISTNPTRVSVTIWTFDIAMTSVVLVVVLYYTIFLLRILDSCCPAQQHLLLLRMIDQY